MLRTKSREGARDYLVQLIGHDEYPEALKVPIIAPKVLLDAEFTTTDPLLIWRSFITEKDLLYVVKHTNKNAAEVSGGLAVKTQSSGAFRRQI